jgi:hypothetical protein
LINKIRQTQMEDQSYFIFRIFKCFGFQINFNILVRPDFFNDVLTWVFAIGDEHDICEDKHVTQHHVVAVFQQYMRFLHKLPVRLVEKSMFDFVFVFFASNDLFKLFGNDFYDSFKIFFSFSFV